MAVIVPTISLTDSIDFNQALGNVTSALSTGLATALSQAPDEADGDPLPTSGVYISGDGVVKYVKASS